MDSDLEELEKENSGNAQVMAVIESLKNQVEALDVWPGPGRPLPSFWSVTWGRSHALPVSFKRSLIYLLPQVVFIIDIIFIIYTFIILR